MYDFLNQIVVKQVLKADVNTEWEECSQTVEDKMGEDVMKSSK